MLCIPEVVYLATIHYMEEVLLGTEATQQGWEPLLRLYQVVGLFIPFATELVFLFSLRSLMKYNIFPLKTHILLKTSEISIVNEIIRV